jgi:hypothetical protein
MVNTGEDVDVGCISLLAGAGQKTEDREDRMKVEC